MNTYSNGYRFYNYDKWGDIKKEEYDYVRNGLFNRIMSHVIVSAATDENGNWKNNLLGNILKFAENSLIIAMDGVKRLQHFHDIGYMNR